MQAPWKLLAALGGVNLAVGAVVLAVGFLYDWLDKGPGQIAMVGVAMMSTPFFLLSAILRSHAKAFADEVAARKRMMMAETQELEELLESKSRRAVVKSLKLPHSAEDIDQ